MKVDKQCKIELISLRFALSEKKMNTYNTAKLSKKIGAKNEMKTEKSKKLESLFNPTENNN